MKAGKIFRILLIVVSIAGMAVIYSAWKIILEPNVRLSNEAYFLHIPTGADFNRVVKILQEDHILKNSFTFKWLGKELGYDQKVKAGRYRLINGMNNRELIALLRSGKQSPVKLTFNSLRTISQLSGIISRSLEADSLSILKQFSDTAFLNSSGFTFQTLPALFIPNTYEFYWNTSAQQFAQRMLREYLAFWTEERRRKALIAGLTPIEVSSLASIVEMETNREDERKIIAGVYLNRLKKGWKLEADPTLVFISGNFGMKRVLNIHKEIDSPYNTYRYAGLPPGPICIPSISSIDAVLNFAAHDYMFFCANDDFSGRHVFAKSYAEHMVNASRFRRELNRRNIKG